MGGMGRGRGVRSWGWELIILSSYAPCPMTPVASTEDTSASHWLPHAHS